MKRALARCGKLPRSGIAGASCAAFLFAMASVASAHPAGFTSVNRYLGFECDGTGQLHVAYLLDFAELPSYSEFERLDANHDGNVSPEEQRAYLDSRLPPIVASWKVDIDGAPASLHVTGSSLDVREGERGMSILRIAAEVTAVRASPLPTGRPGSAREGRGLGLRGSLGVA